jgi:hypothetical protein
MNDSYQSFLDTKEKFEEKITGKEMVSGFECDKTELYDSEKK